MFWHDFKYNWLVTWRDKTQLFWSFLFVVALGTLFYVSFGNAYKSSEMITSLPVVAYFEDKEVEKNFKMFVENISFTDDSEEKLLDVTYVESVEAANKLLEEKEVRGFYYSDGKELKLTVNKNGIKEGILSRVVSEYHKMISVMSSVGEKNQDAAISSAVALMASDNNNKEIKLTSGNMDPFVSYFYNLLAMGCIFAAFTGVFIATRSQGNQTTMGARKIVSGANGVVGSFAAIFANSILLFLAELCAFLYLSLIGVDFGTKYGAIFLLIYLATLNGLGLGYIIGSIKNMGKDAKIGLCVGIGLTLCFLSGLMILDMKYIVQEKAPLFNRINPPAIFADTMYALNIYDNYNVYWNNVLVLLIETVLFLVISAILGRRKSYANI